MSAILKLALIVILGLLLGWVVSPWDGGEQPDAAGDAALPDFSRQEPVYGMQEGRILSLRFDHPAMLVDADLAGLSELPDLELLDLRGTQITDAGLTHLKWLQRLRELYLDGTWVSARGVIRLADELPQCDIWWQGRNWNPWRMKVIPGAIEIRAST